MKMIRFATALLMTVAATAVYAAQQNTFDIKTQGTVTGNCHYTFDSGKNGFKVTSHYLNHIPPQFRSGDAVTGKAAGGTTEIQKVANYKLDANYNYAGGSVTDSPNQISVSYSLNKQRTTLQVSKMQAGTFSGDPIQAAVKDSVVLLPDLDVSALQTFLYMATTHPAPENKYDIVLPSEMGPPQDVVVVWTPQADATGTLNGKAVALKHYVFAYTGKSYDIYGDATNTMMEADITGNQTISYVRTGFALDAAK